mmetsp:Transcript_3649/g.8027  ORF Transcript_3649/g.8027 Transcript_3649/m.8027 type:complete len:182 (-) Transcript_3649:1900-2445(-)
MDPLYPPSISVLWGFTALQAPLMPYPVRKVDMGIRQARLHQTVLDHAASGLDGSVTTPVPSQMTSPFVRKDFTATSSHLNLVPQVAMVLLWDSQMQSVMESAQLENIAKWGRLLKIYLVPQDFIVLLVPQNLLIVKRVAGAQKDPLKVARTSAQRGHTAQHRALTPLRFAPKVLVVRRVFR